MSKRSKARELTLQMLFLVDANSDIEDKAVLEMIQERIEDQEMEKLSWMLFSGTMKQRDLLDTQIKKAAQNWAISRMTTTDRNLLRLGCFELQNCDTPTAVVINEAIKLAKKFGTENSASFINGVLDKLAKDSETESKTENNDSQKTPS